VKIQLYCTYVSHETIGCLRFRFSKLDSNYVQESVEVCCWNRKTVAALAIFVPIYIKYGADTDSGRRLRLKLKFGGPIANPSLNDRLALSQKNLADAMRNELVHGIDFLSGVRIVWTEDGTDQTTAVKNAVNQLIAEGKIAGCIYLKPSMSESECAFKWFERSTSDMFGPIFRPDAFLSSVLGNNTALCNDHRWISRYRRAISQI